MEGAVTLVPGNAVLHVDLEAPGPVGRLAVELGLVAGRLAFEDASMSPGAVASANSLTLRPERLTTIAPAIDPKRIPPQTPRPPFQTSKIPFHFGSGTSLQLVRSW